MNEQNPLLLKGRVYVPLRIVGENLDYKVEWDGLNKQVLIYTSDEKNFSKPPKNNSNNIRILIDNNVLNFSSEYGQPFITQKGRTMIPLRIVAESLNCQVNWVSGVVVINKNKNTKVAIANREVDKTEFKKQIDVTNLNSIEIMGKSIATREQLQAFLNEQEPKIKEWVKKNYNKEFRPFPDLIDLYLTIGNEYGIRGDIAFCQALKETGYFQFTGDVKPFQNNYCGLWATGQPLTGEKYYNGVDPKKVFFIPGLHGLTFANPQIGVEAHIQHLYAYATTKPLPAGKELVDPRFKYVKRGIAPTWTALNGKWAVPGNGYGESILRNYWLKALEK